MLKYFLIFLLFMTLWLIIIAVAIVFSRFTERRAVRLSDCCLKVPHSSACARTLQEMQDLTRELQDKLKINYGEVAAAFVPMLGLGHQLQAADYDETAAYEEPAAG